MDTEERWAPIPTHPGYEASDQGRVRSTDRVVVTHRKSGQTIPRNLRGKVLLQRGTELGYALVNLGGRRTRLVHQLVLEAFTGVKQDSEVTRHLDGDPTNNRLENLLWGTQTENLLDRVRHGNDPNANKRHCPQGHPYDETNTYVPSGRNVRVCKTCNRIAARSYRARRGLLTNGQD